MKIEATRTMQGNATHARVVGSSRTLCGRQAFGQVFADSANTPERLVSCHKCRKSAGWSYLEAAPLGRTISKKGIAQ